MTNPAEIQRRKDREEMVPGDKPGYLREKKETTKEGVGYKRKE